MKNLKKVLSLVLALAMALSLMTVAFAADASDFADYDKVANTEAVDVMVALGVFDGVENNNFNPTGELTREQAAKIITYMLLGKADADKLTADVAPYSDVSADRWSAGAIAYCTSEGIIAGSNGKFDPTGKLTGQQFAKMLLVALGYDPKVEGLEGSSWAINASKLAVKAGLDDNLGSLSAVMTREQAAQMAFNAEIATMVEYQGGVDVSTSDGTNVTVGATRYNVSNTEANDYRKVAAKQDKLMQFCEQNAKDLKLTTGGTDDFGRPAVKWEYKKSTVGTYADDPDFTFTALTKEADLEKALKGYKFTALTKDNVYTNGSAEGTTGASAINSFAQLATMTKNGNLVQIWVDDEKNITNLTQVTESIAQITKIDTKNKEVTLSLKTPVGGMITSVAKVTEDDDCYSVLAAMNQDDYVLITAKAGTGTTGTVVTAKAAETVTGKVTAVKNSESLTLGGNTYELAMYQKDVSGLGVDKDNDKILYLDSYGYALYTTSPSASTTPDVIYVVDKYTGVSDWSNSTTMIQGVLTDGTVVKAEYKAAAGTTVNAGNAYNYTKDGDVYELTSTNPAGGIGTAGLGASGNVDSKDKKLTLGAWNNYYSADVKFIFANGNKSDLKVTVKDGVQNVALKSTDYVVISKDGDGNLVISAVFVTGTAVTKSDDIIYITAAQASAASTGTKLSNDGKKTLTGYEMYVNGEKQTVYFDGTPSRSAGFFTYTVDDTTGAWALGSAPTNVKTGASISSVTLINGTYYLEGVSEVAGYDATNAVVVDAYNSSNKVESMADLKDYVTTSKSAAIVFDSDDKTVDMIYVLS